ncbi:MAG TPA: CAP domain-containing protein [Thermoanaerobaculia bacterium]|nr:CAP domain-containing protein [Thermoanaerobaculia bacterium]
MNRLIGLLTTALLLATPLAQGENAVEETQTTLRSEMLRLINRDRAMYRLAPVQLDPITSTIADRYCRTQIRNGTTGHFTVDGQAPYMRYSFSGGNDGLSENTAAWSATYTFSERALYEMVRRSQDAMMAEEPPHDGHRRTILDPSATHVGIGFAWEKGEFRIAQEFIRRYVDWTRPLPRAASVGEQITCAGKPSNGMKIEAISVHHEALPQSMPPHVANLINSYRLPDTRKDYLPRLRTVYAMREDRTLHILKQEYSDGRRGDFFVGDDGGFSFTVPFPDGPGIYTVVVWVKKDGEKNPIAASNVSIRVDTPAATYGSR